MREDMADGAGGGSEVQNGEGTKKLEEEFKVTTWRFSSRENARIRTSPLPFSAFPLKHPPHRFADRSLFRAPS